MSFTVTKRGFLGGASATLGALLLGAGCSTEAVAETFEVTRSEEQWRRLLTPAQYRVLRDEGTEQAGSSPLNQEHRSGAYLCAGCNLPVYRSQDKFESGTGWPSFVRPIQGNVRTRPDNTLLTTRTEAHCRRCGSHLGHVFEDGPPPTGQRWCMNGVAMRFAPARA